MKISIICLGKIKEIYWGKGIEEFVKRLSAYVSLEIIELAAYQIKQPSDELKARKIEAEKILNHIGDNDYTIALAINGKELSSEELAEKFKNLSMQGYSRINLIIGSSTGLDESVTDKANFLLSFSKMTFPHQLMRLILMEQIYRAFKIINNEPYHK